MKDIKILQKLSWRGGDKTRIENPGAAWLRKKTQSLPTSCANSRLNPHSQLSRPCIHGTCRRPSRAPTKENALALIAVGTGGKTHRSRTRLESELPRQQSRDQHSVGGHPREVGDGKDSESRDSRKTFICIFSLVLQFFWIFFFSFFPLL